jgi:hypothetical protein
MSFCPSVSIDHCEKSNHNEHYIKHVFANIYDFHFKPISMVHFEDQLMGPVDNYIVETSIGLRLSLSNPSPNHTFRRLHLKIDQWYKCCGGLAIGDHRDSIYDKAPSLAKYALTTGKLVSISEKLWDEDIWNKYHKQVKRLNYGKGVYRDMEEFKLDMLSSYLKKPVEFESTDLPETVGYSPSLIFCIEIMTQ